MNMIRTFVVVMLSCLGLAGTTFRSAWAADGVVLPLPPEDQQELAARLGPGVVGQALPSSPIASSTQYFPLQ